MAKTRKQKEEDVIKLAEKLARSKSVVFTDYRGWTMNQLSALRNKLADQQAEFSVTKNTLMNLSLKQSTNYPTTLPSTISEGPTATLFSFEDEIMPLKTLVKALKEAAVGKIKGGIVDGVYYDTLGITRLSELLGKLELQAQVVGLIAAPLIGCVNVLQGNLRNFVYALDQIRLQKGGE